MRAFIALEIPPALRGLISRRVADARIRLPHARWVKESAYHLTLHFLGEIETEVASVLERTLTPVFTSRRQFSVQLAQGGAFPEGKPARILWLGIDRPDRAVELAEAVQAACTGLAVGKSGRPFMPHLTVARCPRPWPRSSVESWISSWRGSIGEPFAVTRGVLMRSHLGAGGARYEVVVDFPLGTG